VAKRATQSGRVRLSQSERDSSNNKEAQFNSGQESPVATPEGYRFTEEVPSTEADNLTAVDAPKARVDGQEIPPPKLDLSPDSLTLANLALGSANGFVVMMFGQECALYDGEKKLLYPSLARVINRMPAASAAKASVFIDPIVLLLGLGIWTNRIISIKSKQRTEANTITAREFATASGINWDRNQQSPPTEGANRPPGPTGNGAGTVPPEAKPDTANANGVVGKVPDTIADSRDDNINGPG
jgi:hypothetical protein